MDQIGKDEVEKLRFPGSASKGNNAMRAMRAESTYSIQRIGEIIRW